MTINRKKLEAKSNEELLRLEQDMVDLFPVNELKELTQMIKEILEERKNDAVMKPFTNSLAPQSFLMGLNPSLVGTTS